MSIVEIIPLLALLIAALVYIARGTPSNDASADDDLEEDLTKVWWGR